MQRLSLPFQDFRELRQENALYVDKTRRIYDLVKNEKACFLSRPSGFGKSLLLSTFEALFSGPASPEDPPNKHYFNGLWIGG